MFYSKKRPLLSLECTSEASLRCGSAPLNALPAGSPHDEGGIFYAEQAVPAEWKAPRGVCASEATLGVFDMSLTMTAGS